MGYAEQARAAMQARASGTSGDWHTGQQRVDDFISHSMNTAHVPGQASPAQVKWDELFAPGSTLTQAELDALKRYAVNDERALSDPRYIMQDGESGNSVSDTPGKLYMLTPGAGNGSQHEAVGLAYRPTYQDIPGLVEDQAPGGDGIEPTKSYTINGKPVIAVSGAGRNGIKGFREITNQGEGGDQYGTEIQYMPTGNYEVVDGVDRYERDLVEQWKRDAEGGFLDKLTNLAPALILAAATGGAGMGSAMGLTGGQALAANAIAGGLTSAISGGNPLTGALSAGAGSFAGDALKGIEGFSQLPAMAQGAINGGVTGLLGSTINGGDMGRGAVLGAVSGGVTGATGAPVAGLLSGMALSAATQSNGGNGTSSNAKTDYAALAQQAIQGRNGNSDYAAQARAAIQTRGAR